MHEFDGLTASELGSVTFGEDDSCRLVFINGQYSEELSTACALPAGTRVRNLAAALETERELIEPDLARLAWFQDNPFVALNTAFLADGAFVYIPRRTVVEQVLHLVFLSSARGEASVSYPRKLIVVGDDSQANIVESWPRAAADGAGGAGRLGRAGVAADQYADCLAARRRRGVVAELRGPG